MTSGRPIFVVGCPRSGTTLLRSILDAHPRICCPVWETGVFVALAQMLDRDSEWHAANDSLIGDLRPRMLQWARRSVETMMQELTAQVGKPRWAEKTPAHVLHIRLIHEVFPEAQFLHIIRNGRDVVRSLQNMPWAPRRIRWSSQRWIDSIQCGRDAASKLPVGRYMEVRYEELTKNPDELVHGLCAFLGEDFVPQMLAFNRAENNSWGKERQPLRAAPINQYPKLSFLERLVFSKMAGTLMHELGYR
jgi:Sulfotransferase family